MNTKISTKVNFRKYYQTEATHNISSEMLSVWRRDLKRKPPLKTPRFTLISPSQVTKSTPGLNNSSESPALTYAYIENHTLYATRLNPSNHNYHATWRRVNWRAKIAMKETASTSLPAWPAILPTLGALFGSYTLAITNTSTTKIAASTNIVRYARVIS